MNSMKILLVIFFISHSFVNPSLGDLIDDVCRKSSDYKLCVESLRANPKSSSADQKGLTRIMLQLSLAKAKNIYNEVLILLQQTKEVVLKQCLQICKDNYDEAVDDITSSIEYLDANEFFFARSFAIDATDDSSSCEESFAEPPIRKSPLKPKSDDFLHFVETTVSLINLLRNS
ncbi:pectinesterase inhibitor-like [Nicotiana tomentosiformis]|nr:pectinesterase inhibitor-like [Nicotiana tomentosiformis]